MGTVFEIFGVKIRVIPGDHLPMHVHCEGGGAFIRFNLETKEWIDDQTKFSRKALEVLEAHIMDHYADCVDEWSKCNGKKKS